MEMLARIIRTRETHPQVIEEAWSFQRSVENHVLANCATFRTLRRFLVMLTACWDEGRLHGCERAYVLMIHCFTVAESAAKDPTHSLEWM